MGDAGRVVLLGDDGALAWRVVRLLRARGTEVGVVVGAEEDAAAVARGGARPLVADTEDTASLTAALRGSTAVVRLPLAPPPHTAAAAPASWTPVTRWRTVSAEAVARACDAAAVPVHLAESTTDVYAGGDAEAGENAAVHAAGSAVLESALAGERHAHSVGGRGVVLRFGDLYGRDVGSSVELVSLLQRRRYTLVGAGRELRPAVHVDDAAAAVVAALALPAGTYNVVDDVPTTLRAQLAALAAAVDAPPLRRLPRFMGRAMRGEGWAWLSRSQRVSAARLRDAAGWRPAVADATLGWPRVVEEWRIETGRAL